LNAKGLPEGWEWKKLEDIADILSGNGAPQDEIYFKNGQYPFVRTYDVGRVKRTSKLVQVRDFINELAIKESKFTLFPEKTLLIPKSGASTFLNHRVLLGIPAFISSHLAGVISKGEVLPEFLYYWSLTIDAKHLTHDVSYPSLRLSEIGSARVPLPPLETQRKIVAILEKAEATQRLRAEADALTQKLMQSVFLEMFGDPVTNPRGWDIAQLSDLGLWTSGGTPSRSKPEYFQGNIPWYTTGELNDSFLTDSTEHINEEALSASHSVKVLPAGTMLIGMYDSAAFKLGILTKPSSFNQACAAFSPNNNVIDTVFALHLFKMMRSVFLHSRRGVRQKNLNQAMIKEFKVPLPPLYLQRIFSKYVERTYHIKGIQQRSTQEIETLQKTLFLKAFSGELLS